MSHLGHSRRLQWLRRLIFFTLLILNTGLVPAGAWAQSIQDAEESHPGLGLESRYSEAVIAYNRKQTATAIKILDELLAQSPKNPEFLELKALALKSTGAPQKSLSVYKELYAVTPEAQRGPYAFELGNILNDMGKPDDAKIYFLKAISKKFNVAPSYLYLGINAFKAGDFAEAERAFSYVIKSDNDLLELIGRYYLGICYFKLGHGPQGIQELMDVRRLSAQKLGDPMIKNIADGSEKMLTPFSNGQWFGNVTLQAGYDSNVQQLPGGIINPSAGVNPATIQGILSGGGGYMSAPVDPLQWVAGYRANYNYNVNSQTQGFDYLTNTASLYLNYHTLDRTSGGLKIESNYAFQNSLSDPTNSSSSYLYQPYDFTWGGGPYFRHQMGKFWRMELSLEVRNQTFYTDATQTGVDWTARTTFKLEQSHPFINPGFNLTYENNSSNGNSWWYNAYGGGINNTMNLVGQITLVESFDYVYSNYLKTLPLRVDQTLTGKIAAVKVLNPKWSILASATYILDNSTITASNSYNRLLVSAGVGYTF